MAINEEGREVSNFDQISLQHTGEMIIEQGEQDSLVIEAEADLLPKLKSEVRNGRLELGLKHWYDALSLVNPGPIRYRITTRSLRGISISGAGRASTGPIHTDRMEIKVSGSGNIDMPELRAESLDISFSGTGKGRIGGAVQREVLHISGSAEVDSAGLASQTVDVHISGSGSVRVDALESLDVHISGSGDVGYLGQPSLHQHISGVAKIHPL